MVTGIWRWKWGSKVLWLATGRWSRLRGCCWDRSVIGTNLLFALDFCCLKTSNHNICIVSCRYLIFARKWALLQFYSAEGGNLLYLKVLSSIYELENGPLKTKMIWYEIQLPSDGREVTVWYIILIAQNEQKKNRNIHNDKKLIHLYNRKRI